jgi:hypothetical protein
MSMLRAIRAVSDNGPPRRIAASPAHVETMVVVRLQQPTSGTLFGFSEGELSLLAILLASCDKFPCIGSLLKRNLGRTPPTLFVNLRETVDPHILFLLSEYQCVRQLPFDTYHCSTYHFCTGAHPPIPAECPSIESVQCCVN